MNNSYRCCICGKAFVGFGNNPWPVTNDADARCCDSCNAGIVVPTRIRQVMEKHSGTEQSKPR